MNHYGVILRQLRLRNQLQMKEAARRVGKSTGWLSQAENGKGKARLQPQEFERIVTAYGGEAYRKQFGQWIALSHRLRSPAKDICLGGAVLKFLRKKAKFSLEAAAKDSGLSKSYLSRIETGSKSLPQPLWDKLMKLYGYSPSSFKNFTTEDKRAKNVPARYRLTALLNQMDDSRIEKILGFSLSILENPYP
jgi:transcriptional regulator with XRE-family HTH domain